MALIVSVYHNNPNMTGLLTPPPPPPPPPPPLYREGLYHISSNRSLIELQNLTPFISNSVLYPVLLLWPQLPLNIVLPQYVKVRYVVIISGEGQFGKSSYWCIWNGQTFVICYSWNTHYAEWDMSPWWPLLELPSQCLLFKKSLQHIWRLGTCRLQRSMATLIFKWIAVT